MSTPDDVLKELVEHAKFESIIGTSQTNDEMNNIETAVTRALQKLNLLPKDNKVTGEVNNAESQNNSNSRGRGNNRNRGYHNNYRGRGNHNQNPNQTHNNFWGNWRGGRGSFRGNHNYNNNGYYRGNQNYNRGRGNYRGNYRGNFRGGYYCNGYPPQAPTFYNNYRQGQPSHPPHPQ